VAAVCHHGGAGTTAAGLRAGKPTIVVPFFGDQFFWGAMISKSGAGPEPIPGKRLNANDLIEAFKVSHEAGTRAAANKLRIAFEHENGCEAAVQSFHSHLPLHKMRSDLEPTFAACFRLNDYDLQISRPVAQVLVASGAIEESALTLLATRDWRASLFDGRPHVPIHGLVKHGRKAFTSLFIDTAQGIRRAASSNSITTGALDGAESVVKGVGKSIGHVYVGCLSFYGEITDVLEYLPKLYDPYSDSDKRKRPQVDNFSSGARAAEHSIWHGFKDGVTGIVNKPRAGYQRHGVLGGAAGAAVAIPNIVIKPVVGTLASITWLGRGLYAEAKLSKHHKDSNSNHRLSVLTPNGHRRSSSGSTIMNEDTSPAGQASFESGLHIDICKQILTEFERIKTEHSSKSSCSTNDKDDLKVTKKQTKFKNIFQRQRSHSASGH
jgi:sterol 3beta-glucosyltransferase